MNNEVSFYNYIVKSLRTLFMKMIIRFLYSQDIEDIDFTADKTSLALSWSGFVHPHQNVTFRACIGTVARSCDVASMENASQLKNGGLKKISTTH